MLPLLAAGALSVVCQMFRRWNSRTVEADWGMTGPRVTVLVMLVHTYPSASSSSISRVTASGVTSSVPAISPVVSDRACPVRRFPGRPAAQLRADINALGERIRPDLEQGASAPPEPTTETRDQL
jgi:hypothetical protein